MNIIIVGPQGSGKGTQAEMLAEKLKIPHISTGEILRNVSGELKKKVEQYVVNGKLVPDNLVMAVLIERLSRSDCKNGFILDGFPRTVAQCQQLNKITKIDVAIEISVSEEEAIKRISNRVLCKKCGMNYNLETKKPKEDFICDNCGGELIKRKDDNEKAIKKRLALYNKETKKVLRFYKTIKINGEQPIEKVYSDILEELKRLNIIKKENLKKIRKYKK